MLKKLLIGLGMSAAVATLAYAQDAAPGNGAAATPAAGAPAAGGRAARGAGGAGAGPARPAKLPTQAQWDNMPQDGKDYVAKAVAEAGSDGDLQFDEKIFCQASGGAGNNDRATLGSPNSEPHLPAYPSPSPAVNMPAQHMFDNFWWLGDSGVGSWLITTKAGYILFDASNDPDEAQTVIVDAMQKVGLDPKKIKYMIFGHFHLDHTGGGHLIETIAHPKIIMGRDDWPLYYKSLAPNPNAQAGQGSRIKDKTTMQHGIDATDGMKITVGDVTATIYEMTGHTPGSLGMVVPVKWQGKQHPILIVTAGTDFGSREAFIGGYEHIWDLGEKAKVESVMQVHPNTNMNTLARTVYVNDNFDKLSKGGKNPLLYGVDRTHRYIEIMRACSQARMSALGW